MFALSSNPKHRPPTTGAASGSANSNSRSTVSGRNVISESTIHSQSALPYARNLRTSELRGADRFAPACRARRPPPFTIR